MTTRKVAHGGTDYDVVSEQLPNGKFIARIDPRGGVGRYIRTPDIQSTDPANNRTVTKQGPPLEFDTEKGALDAGEDNIRFGMI